MFYTTPVFFRWRYLSLAALISIAYPQAALVQGLDAPNAIDKIIGTDVHQNEATAVDDEDDVLGAIDKTAENINVVKMTTKLDRISIVYLSDMDNAPRRRRKVEKGARDTSAAMEIRPNQFGGAKDVAFDD